MFFRYVEVLYCWSNAQTVEDAALLFSVITGNKPVDLKSKPFEGRRLAILKGTALNDLQQKLALAFEELYQSLVLRLKKLNLTRLRVLLSSLIWCQLKLMLNGGM